ncbi:serine/threonine-protein kinase pim-3-like [Cyprinus carpio]|uniref:non-specific serine/threonine protein kinase n=1 Tax=Cyprinus carpio TaxID=7962 RepID=A0A9R0ATI1_CYPCA|nr:serine/threonine-protein kinase pim-3-like [Cyprinus carpio]
MRLELSTMRRVQRNPPCDHIIRLFEWFYTEDQVILIMERPPNSVTLFEFIKHSKGHPTERAAKVIVRQIIVALHHCNVCGVHHNHTHLRNILINRDTLQLKLIDFGGARLIAETPSEERTLGAVSRETAVRSGCECLYRVLCALIKGIPFWIRLSRECTDLLQELKNDRTWNTLENILDHAWFKEASTVNRGERN